MSLLEIKLLIHYFESLLRFHLNFR